MDGLSHYQFDILFHVEQNPHIKLVHLYKPFKSRFRLSPLFPFLIFEHRFFTESGFKRELNVLKDNGLLLFTPYDSKYTGDDRDLVYYWKDFNLSSFDVAFCLFLTENGRAAIEREFLKRNLPFFSLLVAIVGVVVSALT